MLQVTKLRVSGFKSFVDAAELLIEPGLTGIVGPNGCGKSNLIEALRWVMGETSAKQMRGGEMDDVIFAGSAGRPSRNVAEVILEIDNAARVAPPPYSDEDELLVSRRIERAKGSVYRVNGREVRARDVHLLLADAATGARSAALVTQGQVAQLIAAKPIERRALLEEAAGVVGLHARRHEAELRLQAAESNLRRLDDIVSTLDVQRQQLKKQARQTGRYRKIAAQIRTLEATLLWCRSRDADRAAGAARNRLADAEHAVVTATAGAAAAATSRTELAGLLPELRRQEAEAGAAAQQLVVERNLLETEARQATRDSDLARARAQQIATDLARERALAADAVTSIDRLTAERARLAELRRGEPEALAMAETALADSRSAVAALEQRTNDLTERVATERARRSALQRNCDEAAGQARRLATRCDELSRQCVAARAEMEALPDADAAEAALRACEQAAAETRARLERAEAERVRLAAEEAAAAGELGTAEAAFAQLSAQGKALSDVLAAEPADSGCSLLDSITAEPGDAAALAAALGDDLLAAEDEQAPSRWRMLPAYAEAQAPLLPRGAAPLAAGVHASAALARRLAQIGIVETEIEGDRLQAALLPGQRLATRGGAVWRWDGYTRAAGAETSAGVRLRQRTQLDALRPHLIDAERTLAAVVKRHETLHQAAAAAVAAQTQLRARQKTEDIAVTAARQRFTDVESKRARIDVRLAALEAGRTAAEADHGEALARSTALADELATLPDGREEQRSLEALRSELSKLRSSQLERQARLDAVRRDSAGRSRRLQGIDAEIASWNGRLDGMRRQIEDIARRQRETNQEIEQLQLLAPVLTERRRQLLEKSEAADAFRRECADHLAVAEARMGEIEQSLRKAEKELAAAREHKVRAEAQRDQTQQAVQAAAEAIMARLGSRPEALAEVVGDVPDDLDLPAEENRLERLRRDREAMGPVNLRADEEAAELETRVADLQRQRLDLIEAIGKLRRGIAELDREGRDRLRAAFTDIDRNFQALFQHLFGGGRAHLALTESDDPLAAGLEIMASPPGKKLQMISLLSGGEQALTALALRFAVFVTRPTPICVLDEVDAALDDANVDRFCSLLSERAKNGTRFLVVTHHRLTMARMDRLFGVTMSERGASRLVSVDLVRAQVLRHTA